MKTYILVLALGLLGVNAQAQAPVPDGGASFMCFAEGNGDLTILSQNINIPGKGTATVSYQDFNVSYENCGAIAIPGGISIQCPRLQGAVKTGIKQFLITGGQLTVIDTDLGDEGVIPALEISLQGTCKQLK